MDKTVLAEKRVREQDNTLGQRQGSLEPQDIEHIVVEGEDYAVVKKSPKRKKKLPADLSALINPPDKAAGRTERVLRSNEPVPPTGKKSLPGKQRSVDSALQDDAKRKKSAEIVQSKSPKPARRNKDANMPTGLPRNVQETTEVEQDVSYSAISHITNNGLDYAIVDTKIKKKFSTSSAPSPMSSNSHQLDGASKEMGASEFSEPRRGVIQSDDNEPGDRKKIEYSTVVFANSVPVPENTEQTVEVKDFDRTKFDYSTVVFQNFNLSEKDKRGIIKPSQPQARGEQTSKGSSKVKKSIYDSDDNDGPPENSESPYVNVRRDGRPITASNVPPAVPPRRGAAAIINDDDSS